MADRIREVQAYIILDDTQANEEMPQAHMAEDVVDAEGTVTGTKQKTVTEAYPDARKSLDKKQLVIPLEVGPDETFEVVYAAIKFKFKKPVMAHKETIKALDNDKWRETEVIPK
jgi:hypothetical protein